MSVTKVTELFVFDPPTFIENVIVRPNGRVLLTSTSTNRLFELETSIDDPKPRPVAEFPDSSCLTGIAKIGPDTYAVSGGIMSRPFIFDKGSMRVYTISFGSDRADAVASPPVSSPPVSAPVAKIAAEVNDTEMMNGMASLPDSPEVILSADSRLGRILRVNTRTGAADVAFQSALLEDPGLEERVPCGVNGIKIHQGYLYFVNSAQRIFGRFPIDENGDQVGEAEYATTLSDDAPKQYTDDDFDIDESGFAWVARHPSSLVKIVLGTNEQHIVIDRSSHDVELHNPTATALDRQRNILYIVSGGQSFTGGIGGGQVIKVELS